MTTSADTAASEPDQFHEAAVRLVRDMMNAMQNEHFWSDVPEIHARVNALLCSTAPTTGSAPVAPAQSERKAIAKSVFGGINALRWILNITTEFDRKDVRTRQAARLLDDHCTGEGTTNRAHLEHLWKTLNDALSLEDKLDRLAAPLPMRL